MNFRSVFINHAKTTTGRREEKSQHMPQTSAKTTTTNSAPNSTDHAQFVEMLANMLNLHKEIGFLIFDDDIHQKIYGSLTPFQYALAKIIR